MKSIICVIKQRGFLLNIWPEMRLQKSRECTRYQLGRSLEYHVINNNKKQCFCSFVESGFPPSHFTHATRDDTRVTFVLHN